MKNQLILDLDDTFNKIRKKKRINSKKFLKKLKKKYFEQTDWGVNVSATQVPLNNTA